MEGNYHGQRWTMWLTLKESVKTVRYSLSAICGEKVPAHSTVFIWIWSFSSGKETAQVAAHEWHLSTPKEWFCKASWKL
jgi:hypothetical protein